MADMKKVTDDLIIINLYVIIIWMKVSRYTIVLLGGQVQDKIGQADGGRQHCDD
jgi:hypothetical protein